MKKKLASLGYHHQSAINTAIWADRNGQVSGKLLACTSTNPQNLRNITIHSKFSSQFKMHFQPKKK
jgi:hypothetical protein